MTPTPKGAAAPATEFSSAGDVRRMFAGFSEVGIRRENFDDIVVRIAGRTLAIPRTAVLGNVARIAGSDLYVTATK